MVTGIDHFVLGAALNLAVVAIIVRGIYFPLTQNRSYVFTFLAFSPTIYFAMSLLTSMEVGVGVGFGLFAIFSVIRYRTEEMAIREMTYLFIIIALPIMNAILAADGDLVRAAIINGTTVALLLVLEREWGFRFDRQRTVVYDRIDLITPGRYDELLADLRARTGLPVVRAEVGHLDFLRDTAQVTVFYEAHQARPGKPRPGLAAERRAVNRRLLDP